eukprot:13787157-Alexandrium_andersonii.AAC.1
MVSTRAFAFRRFPPSLRTPMAPKSRGACLRALPGEHALAQTSQGRVPAPPSIARAYATWAGHQGDSGPGPRPAAVRSCCAAL